MYGTPDTLTYCPSLQCVSSALVNAVVEERLKIREDCSASVAILTVGVRLEFDYVRWKRLGMFVDKPSV